MLVEGLKDIATTKMFDLVPSLYFAGYKAECSSKKEEPKLTREDFDHYVLSADESAAVKLVTDYLNIINPKEEEKPGEEVAQTESL